MLNNKEEILGRTDHLLSFDMTWTTWKMTRSQFVCLRVYAAVTFLPSRYLAAIKGYTYKHTDGTDV
jgi:hypothetical protein